MPEICAKLERSRSIDDTWAALNNAALVFVYGRQPGTARDICTHQLQWAGQNELPELAVQPWINLGRLCRRAGDYEAALKYFEVGQAVSPASPANQPAEPILIYETIRTYVQMGDPDRALAFAEGLREPLQPGSDLLRTELMIQLLLERHALTQLPSLLKKSSWPQDAFGVMVKHLYACSILFATGQQASCVSGLERLLPHVQGWIDRSVCLESRDIRLAIETFRLAQRSGPATLHPPAWSVAFAAVMKSRDVLYATQLFRLSEGVAMAAADMAHLGEFIGRFDYSAFPDSPAVQRLSKAVTAVLSGELCGAVYAH